MKMIGDISVRCKRCKRVLLNEVSRIRGYGYVCYKKVQLKGWEVVSRQNVKYLLLSILITISILLVINQFIEYHMNLY